MKGRNSQRERKKINQKQTKKNCISKWVKKKKKISGKRVHIHSQLHPNTLPPVSLASRETGALVLQHCVCVLVPLKVCFCIVWLVKSSSSRSPLFKKWHWQENSTKLKNKKWRFWNNVNTWEIYSGKCTGIYLI